MRRLGFLASRAALAPDCIRWQHCLSSPRGGSLRKFPLALIAAVFSILIIAGCHSSGAAVSVQVEPSGTISLDEGQSVNLTATVGNDTQNLGVNWSLVQSSSTACSGSGCGALSKVTNSSATYTAPTNLSAGETVTVTVASIAKPSSLLVNAVHLLSIVINCATYASTVQGRNLAR